MADSSAFSVACEVLEANSGLDKLEARGTIRIALKSAGLEAATVTKDQMKVVVEKVLPDELSARGVEDPGSACNAIAAALENVASGGNESRPEEVFSRLGG